jgi:hypothetical protein
MNSEPIANANKAMSLAASALRNEAKALDARAEWCRAEADRLDMVASDAFSPVAPRETAQQRYDRERAKIGVAGGGLYMPPVRDPGAEVEHGIAELARNLDRAQAARDTEAA